MKLLYASDLHGDRNRYGLLLRRAESEEVDAIVLGGDLCPRGGSTIEEWVGFQKKFLEEYLIPLFKKFRESFPKKGIFLIMGNDDFRKNANVLEKAEEEGILHWIHNRKAVLDEGFSIVGYGFVNTTPFRLKDWEKIDLKNAQLPPQLSGEILRSTEEEPGTIEEDLKKLANLSDPRKTLYVIHAPPYGTNLDITTRGQHVGSKAIRNFIERHNPLATLHGHIHESPRMSGSWMDVVGDTVCINMGRGQSKLSCCIIDPKSVYTVSCEEIGL